MDWEAYSEQIPLTFIFFSSPWNMSTVVVILANSKFFVNVGFKKHGKHFQIVVNGKKIVWQMFDVNVTPVMK